MYTGIHTHIYMVQDREVERECEERTNRRPKDDGEEATAEEGRKLYTCICDIYLYGKGFMCGGGPATWPINMTRRYHLGNGKRHERYLDCVRE